MNEFPFSYEDWQKLQVLTHAIMNATLLNDSFLRASLFEKFSVMLLELRNQYGDHPILHETKADFLDEPLLQMDAYRTAVLLSEKNSLPTLSIRISLARLLLEEFGDPKQAATELIACRPELEIESDEYDIQQWHDLFNQCITQTRAEKGSEKGSGANEGGKGVRNR